MGRSAIDTSGSSAVVVGVVFLGPTVGIAALVLRAALSVGNGSSTIGSTPSPETKI